MDFDRYAHTYSDRVAEAVAMSECGQDFFLTAKADQLLKLLVDAGAATEATVLDVGCGVGLVESYLAGRVGRMIGVDVASETVRIAAEGTPDASFLTYDGLSLPFPDDKFDAAFAICVLHHVRPGDWLAMIKEMSRVVRPNGLVVVFEHNPWNPTTQVVVNRCEFDHDATLLSAPVVRRLLRSANLVAPKLRFLFFFPWLGRVWRAVENYLGWLPLGAQYMAVASKPPREVSE